MLKLFSFARRSAFLLCAVLPCCARAQDRSPVSEPVASLVVSQLRGDMDLLLQAPSQSKAEQEPQAQAEHEKQVEKKEQSERTLGIVPQFGTTDRMDAPPLRSGQKFRLFARTAFDPVTVGIAAAQAGISQADGQFKGYGSGAEGYGKRFGAAFGDQVSSQFFGTFLYPTIFKQDPRYFRLGHGGFFRRFGYGLKQEVVCHTDSGGRAFNTSRVLGAFTSGGISNAYYPSEDRGFGLTMSRSALAMAYAAGGNLLSEFWPDIRRKVFKSK
ncbi:MAG TPA: hypothetical protein VLL05_02295 [Terriglobales bacterium]|nr:hypothetical protein [Terriglobales bacterium]